MKKLQMFENVNGELITYGRSQKAYKLESAISMTFKGKTDDVSFIRYSPNFNSYSVTIKGKDTNIKGVEFVNDSDRVDLEKLLNIEIPKKN